MARKFDRAAEDIGNIISLEHVNVRIPDQRLSTLFYIAGLGLTRDPYLMASVTNMWVNVGRSQFHLPTGGPDILRGRVGLVTPDLAALTRRLEAVREPLTDTRFDFEAANDRVDVTCPWGNRLSLHAPDERFGPVRLGMPYVQFDVPEGAADGIARFYTEVFRAPTAVVDEDGAPAARVSIGATQCLLFRETDDPIPPFDGHHIQVYVADFSHPHAELMRHGLVTEESSQHQYRFVNIVDPDSGETLFELEHEVRSMTHPLYARPLINRDPSRSNLTYTHGYEDEPWAMDGVQ